MERAEEGEAHLQDLLVLLACIEHPFQLEARENPLVDQPREKAIGGVPVENSMMRCKQEAKKQRPGEKFLRAWREENVREQRGLGDFGGVGGPELQRRAILSEDFGKGGLLHLLRLTQLVPALLFGLCGSWRVQGVPMGRPSSVMAAAVEVVGCRSPSNKEWVSAFPPPGARPVARVIAQVSCMT